MCVQQATHSESASAFADCPDMADAAMLAQWRASLLLVVFPPLKCLQKATVAIGIFVIRRGGMRTVDTSTERTSLLKHRQYGSVSRFAEMHVFFPSRQQEQAMTEMTKLN